MQFTFGNVVLCCCFCYNFHIQTSAVLFSSSFLFQLVSIFSMQNKVNRFEWKKITTKTRQINCIQVRICTTWKGDLYKLHSSSINGCRNKDSNSDEFVAFNKETGIRINNAQASSQIDSCLQWLINKHDSCL